MDIPVLGSNPYGLRPLDRLEGLIKEIDDLHAALPELVALRIEIEQLHRSNINLCVRVAIGEIIANSGTPDHHTEEERAQDTRDVEALGGSVTGLEIRVGQLRNPSVHAKLLEYTQELESDLRAEKGKVQAKEEAVADSILIREGLERDLERIQEQKNNTEEDLTKKIAVLEAQLLERQATYTQHAPIADRDSHTAALNGSNQQSSEESVKINANPDRPRKQLNELTISYHNGVSQADQVQSDLDKAARKLADLDRDYDILKGENSMLQNQLATLQKEKEAIEEEMTARTRHSSVRSSSQGEPELDRRRTGNSNIQDEVITLRTRIRDLENKWKDYAKGLKESLDEKERELEEALSESHELARDLKRIHDRSQNEAAALARRFPSLGGEEEDENACDDRGEDDSGRAQDLVGFKQPVYNMVIGHRTPGTSRRQISQSSFSTAQDHTVLPDIALKAKSTDPVPYGYAVVKEIPKIIAIENEFLKSVIEAKQLQSKNESLSAAQREQRAVFASEKKRLREAHEEKFCGLQASFVEYKEASELELAELRAEKNDLVNRVEVLNQRITQSDLSRAKLKIQGDESIEIRKSLKADVAELIKKLEKTQTDQSKFL
ncbi:hypothetical protein ACEPPN_011061 [Leptodophora sp. 'Broadleaf-Isolate-01']